MLAGWPFRARYPRGLAFAFARPDGGDSAQTFLASWRDFMGPKCGPFHRAGGAAAYGRGPRAPASVASVEAPYASGIGYTDATPTDGVTPTPEMLVHSAADAMLTAVKRLEGRPPRLVVAIESAARLRLLGSALAEEWAAMRGGRRATPCIGWVGAQWPPTAAACSRPTRRASWSW